MLHNALAGPSRTRSAMFVAQRRQATIWGPLVPRPHRTTEFSAKNTDSKVDLIAPPDPLSKIRPVLYVPTGPVKDIRAPSFASNEYEDALIRMKERELEWLVYRQRVDIENHRFWARQNIAFDAQVDHIIDLTPLSDPPTDAEIKRREDAITHLYANWQIANRRKQLDWIMHWWRDARNWLILQSKIYTARFWWRVLWAWQAPKRPNNPSKGE